MAKNDGGAAFPKCSRCGQPALRRQGHQWLCVKHYRFGSMRSRAKTDGKAVPTWEQLENMLSHLKDNKCPHCIRTMNWLAREGQSTVVSLQHYRSGSMGLICRACNTRHAAVPGDGFCLIPPTHKHCPGCGLVKHLDEFATDRNKRWKNRKSLCRACSNQAHEKWRTENREKYNAIQRAYRAKRKAAGNPVRGGPR